VVNAVVADQVHDRRRCTARVVKIGDPVGESGPEMQQRRRRHAAHAGIAVCRTGADTFEKTQHRAHAIDTIDRLHQMHLRSTRIGETYFHARFDEATDQRFRTIHALLLRELTSVRPSAGRACHG
jgi:hypothetical protein